jgi:hypothetical protein
VTTPNYGVGHKARDRYGLPTELDACFPGLVCLLNLTHVFQALGQHPHPTLTMLLLRGVRLGRDNVRLLGMALNNIPSLQTLVLTEGTLGSAELAELAPALYSNTSIKVLNISYNWLDQGIHRLDDLRTPLRYFGISFALTRP